MLAKIQNSIKKLLKTASNSTSLANQFLRYGSRGVTLPKWNDVKMTDRDLYSGYSFAAIRKRANYVARLSGEVLYTQSKTDKLRHPYLDKIYDSVFFSDYDFFFQNSTYLDLEGVYYLFALRNKVGSKVGEVQYFKLLNPYEMTRVLNPETLEVVGYIEKKGHLVREIPPHMIIEFRDLNPFDWNENLSMSDAAKNPQFALKTSSDFTIKTMNASKNAPYILSTDVKLPDELFENFVARIKGQGEGEPIFANGAGAITAQTLNTNLKEWALVDINGGNRDELISVYGLSKTLMGIEQSGVTRDSTRVQKDLFYEGEVLPRLRTIADTFNLDYRRNYPEQFEVNHATLMVSNPTAVDHEAKVADSEAKQLDFDLYTSLLDKGYPTDKAAQYVEGSISIEELGEPTKPATPDVKETENKAHTHSDECECGKTRNQIDKSLLITMESQETTLQNAIINIQGRLVSNAIEKVNRKAENAITEDSFETEKEVITARDKQGYVNELELVLAGFYAIMIRNVGEQTSKDRAAEYNLPSNFLLNREVRSYIKRTSEKVAESHIKTISEDIYKTAREGAIQGMSQQEIISTLNKKYADQLTENRAKTVARTETNRAFTTAQYQADLQFVSQNGLEKRAYKKWVVNSDRPCPYCEQLASQDAIPLTQSFVPLGGKIEANGSTLDVSFEAIDSGTAHPNCRCSYELIIR